MTIPSDSLKQKHRQGIYLILLLCVVAYFNTLGNGFLNFDDHNERILKNPFLTDPWQWSHLSTAFTQATAGYYDPIYVLSYVLDYQLWGWNPAGFHLHNLLLHAVNSILIFLLLSRLTGRFPLALLAGVFFAVHPIHVESVSWATSRKDTLSLLFALCSMLVYFRGVSGSHKKYFLGAAGSIVLLILGMMTKPTVIVVPIVILLTELFLRHSPIQWKRVLIYQTVSLSLLAGFMILTLPMTLGVGWNPEVRFPLFTHAVLFLQLYGYYLKLIFLPLNLSAFYLIPIHDTAEMLVTFVYVPVFIVLAGWIIFSIRQAIRDTSENPRYRPIVWGVALFLIGLSPFTNIIPHSIYMADRYEYLASIGFCTALAAVLLEIPWKKVRVVFVALLIVFYSALCMDRIPVWKDSPTLWADINQKRNITAFDHHRIMGGAYAFDGKWQNAVEEYEKAGVEKLNDPEERMRVASIYSTIGNHDRAEQVVSHTLLQTPDYIPAMNRLITLHISARDYRKAEEYLKKFSHKFTERENQLFGKLIRYAQKSDIKNATEVYRDLQNSIRSRINHVQKQNRVGGRSGA
ncbi:MAG: hypothetical protein NPINA01_19750 [Nitrospinaceae bacterium]|nr:MAG: hypothetical protein NPINA01_19750 [Nitrospinaceae bacterium]